ncbi:hypothetical protein MKW98_007141 [Papaver atlanticum]|uniref:Uncharacterized protein n=1 Tax=Papaver atlanticum TaxID=357466 RepID=A0AAD4SLF1_9MAGN|nr:hypothetical protein MKW98_007141 [Papaver atlanticum]
MHMSCFEFASVRHDFRVLHSGYCIQVWCFIREAYFWRTLRSLKSSWPKLKKVAGLLRDDVDTRRDKLA